MLWPPSPFLAQCEALLFEVQAVQSWVLCFWWQFCDTPHRMDHYGWLTHILLVDDLIADLNLWGDDRDALEFIRVLVLFTKRMWPEILLDHHLTWLFSACSFRSAGAPLPWRLWPNLSSGSSGSCGWCVRSSLRNRDLWTSSPLKVTMSGLDPICAVRLSAFTFLCRAGMWLITCQ